LKGVKVADIRSTMLNAKHSKNERYPPLEMVSLCYEEIKWVHSDGSIAFVDSWNKRTA
jgi:type VI secretion system Hcp family effector